MRIIYSRPNYGTKELVTDAEGVVVGRPKPGVVVDLDLTPDGQVSRPHARLTYENGAYWIKDLGSTHGTKVNGKRITEKTLLTPGAKVKVGQTTIEVEMEAAPPIPGPSPEPSVEGNISDVVDATRPPFAVPAEVAPDDALAQAQRQLRAFYDLSQALGTATTLDHLIQILVKQLQRAIPNAQHGAVLLQDERCELLLKAHWPPGEPSVSMTWAGRACTERQAFIWTAPDEGSSDAPLSVIHHHVQSAIYAPLLWKGQVLGVVYVDNCDTRQAFALPDIELFRTIANQAAMLVKNHTLQQTLRHEEVVRSNLLRQFSPKVADRLLKERGRLRLGGEQVEPATVLISDVRGFTATSAEMEPDDVVRMLNEMFGKFTPIIFRYNGTVDKYVGDSILAVFGSPEPDDRQWEKAVRAALEMQQAMRELGDRWQTRGFPVFQVGIGVHTGAVIHGFVGSEERMEYTVIGDTVNRTARYCDGAGKGEVLISQEVYGRVFRLLDVSARMVKTKHPKTEGDLQAYLVKSLRDDAA